MANIINLATEDNQEKILKALTAKDGRTYAPIMQEVGICRAQKNLNYSANFFYEDTDFLYIASTSNNFRRINKKDYSTKDFTFTSTNYTYFGSLCTDTDFIYAIFSEKIYSDNSVLYTWIIKINKYTLEVVDQVKHNLTPDTGYNQTDNACRVTLDNDYIYLSGPLYTFHFLHKFKKSDLSKVSSSNIHSRIDAFAPIIYSNNKIILVSNIFGGARVYDTSFKLLYTASVPGTPYNIYQSNENEFIIESSGFNYTKLNISNLAVEATVSNPYKIAFIENGYIYYFIENQLKRLSTDFIFDNEFVAEYEKTDGSIKKMFYDKNNDHLYAFNDLNPTTFYDFIQKYKIIAYEGVE